MERYNLTENGENVVNNGTKKECFTVLNWIAKARIKRNESHEMRAIFGNDIYRIEIGNSEFRMELV